MKEKFESFSPFMQVVMLFVLGFISFLILSMVASIAISSLYPDFPVDQPGLQLNDYPVAYMLVNYLPFQLGFLFVPGALYLRLTRHEKKLLNPSNLKNVGWSFLLFIAAFFLLPVLGEINIEIVRLFGAYDALYEAKIVSDEQIDSLVGELGSTSFYTAILLVAFITGIAEELVFRRFLFHHMLKNTKKLWLSVFSSAFVFALLHFNYIQLLPLLSFGTVLAIMYYVSGSIIPGIIMHALNNSLTIYWLAIDDFPLWMEEIEILFTIPATILLLILVMFKFNKSM